VSNWNTRLTVPTGELGKRKPAEIMVHNRETGKLEEEKIPNYIKIAMRVMYTGSAKFGTRTQPPPPRSTRVRVRVRVVSRCVSCACANRRDTRVCV
jgi:hypothetical protein